MTDRETYEHLQRNASWMVTAAAGNRNEGAGYASGSLFLTEDEAMAAAKEYARNGGGWRVWQLAHTVQPAVEISHAVLAAEATR